MYLDVVKFEKEEGHDAREQIREKTRARTIAEGVFTVTDRQSQERHPSETVME